MSFAIFDFFFHFLIFVDTVKQNKNLFVNHSLCIPLFCFKFPLIFKFIFYKHEVLHYTLSLVTVLCILNVYTLDRS